MYEGRSDLGHVVSCSVYEGSSDLGHVASCGVHDGRSDLGHVVSCSVYEGRSNLGHVASCSVHEGRSNLGHVASCGVHEGRSDLCRRVSAAVDHYQQQYVDDALFLVRRHVVERQRQHVEELARVKSEECSEVRVGALRADGVRRVYRCHACQHGIFHRRHSLSDDLTGRVGVAGQTTRHVDEQLVTELRLDVTQRVTLSFTKNKVFNFTLRPIFNLKDYKSSAVAEMGDCGHNRHGLKREGLLCPFTGGLGPSLTQKSPRLRPTSIPSGISMHPALWPQHRWAKNWRLCPLFEGGSWVPI